MKLSEKITDWIKKYAQNANMNLVVGVSGGIDSAVVSSLCAHTGINTILCTIDIGNTSPLAHKHINTLLKYPNVEYVPLNLYRTYNMFINDNIDHGIQASRFQKELGLLANANLRSRLRMTALYNIAMLSNSLVVGTGNKVEDYGIGFFTKYGDGGVDINPIGDLLKSEVYELGRELDIIQPILDAKPTDGLWDDGRDDETQIGATYDELEWAMKHMDGDYTTNILASRKNIVLKIYNDRHAANKHKMIPIPKFIQKVL